MNPNPNRDPQRPPPNAYPPPEQVKREHEPDDPSKKQDTTNPLTRVEDEVTNVEIEQEQVASDEKLLKERQDELEKERQDELEKEVTTKIVAIENENEQEKQQLVEHEESDFAGLRKQLKQNITEFMQTQFDTLTKNLETQLKNHRNNLEEWKKTETRKQEEREAELKNAIQREFDRRGQERPMASGSTTEIDDLKEKLSSLHGEIQDLRSSISAFASGQAVVVTPQQKITNAKWHIEQSIPGLHMKSPFPKSLKPREYQTTRYSCATKRVLVSFSDPNLLNNLLAIQDHLETRQYDYKQWVSIAVAEHASTNFKPVLTRFTKWDEFLAFLLRDFYFDGYLTKLRRQFRYPLEEKKPTENLCDFFSKYYTELAVSPIHLDAVELKAVIRDVFKYYGLALPRQINNIRGRTAVKQFADTLIPFTQYPPKTEETTSARNVPPSEADRDFACVEFHRLHPQYAKGYRLGKTIKTYWCPECRCSSCRAHQDRWKYS